MVLTNIGMSFENQKFNKLVIKIDHGSYFSENYLKFDIGRIKNLNKNI